MDFLYPAAFAGLVSIPVIIGMYLLKQQHENKHVSSTMLWEKAYQQTLAQRPWQKLRKNILMILQALAALFIVFALTGPFISGLAEAENYIIVLDCSYNMGAMDGEPDRLSQSKAQIQNLVDKGAAGSYYTLIIAHGEPYMAVNFTEDKNAVINRLDRVQLSNTPVNEEALSNLVKTVYEQNNGQVYVFSGTGLSLGEIPSVQVQAGSAADNLAVTLMSHSVDSDRVVSLVKVRNYGRNAAKASVGLYADEMLHDIKEVEIGAGGEADVFFTAVPYGVSRLSAVLMNGDILEIDNIYYDTVEYGASQRAILFTDRNVFLENVMELLPNVELYKGDPANMEGLAGYYLYIFDGVLPAELPQDGHVLILNPPVGNSFIETQGEEEIASVFVNMPGSSMLTYISDMDFGILKAKKVVLPDWGDIILSSDQTPLIIAGEENGRKAVVLSFDLHDTDLPLKKEFPIFMYNLSQWFVPGNVFDGTDAYIGEPISFHIYPDALSARVIAPNGDIRVIAPPFPAAKYDGAWEPGFYILEQDIQGSPFYTDFAVNINTAKGSDLLAAPTVSEEVAQAGRIQRDTGFRNALILIVMVLMLAEWYFLCGGKFRAPDIVRAALILLLCLSLADISLKIYNKDIYTIFAVDLSASVEGGKILAEAVINEAVQEKSVHDSVGVVSFGGNASIESYPDKGFSRASLQSYIDREFTNIAGGLVLAQSLIPENSQKRVVLISDGLENIGDAASVARMFNDQGIAIDVVYTKDSLTDEMQLTKLNVPQSMNKNINYNIEVVAHSVNDGNARLVLYKNGEIFAAQDISLSKGENRYVFSDISDAGGNMIFRAELQPEKDTIYQNNNAYAYSYVEDIPSILVVSHESSGSEIKKILAGSSVNVSVMGPYEVPVSLEQIHMYDTVVLADISADDLPEGFMEGLESYVRGGGGVVATGGENSFALGGYYRTPLEELLPVDMELKDKSNLPNLGMVVVVDRSGSMSSGRYGLSKMELAKEAVIRSVDSLNETDMFGVLAFDDGFDWVSAFDLVGGDAAEIQNRIASISLGGGTSILPALTEAYNVLSNADTKLKHIILLTDGQAEQSGYDAVIDSINNDGITLSTVAVGSDSDVTLLQYLADSAGGRYYYTDEFTDLPKIFTKETFLAGKNYINNVDFYPRTGHYSVILNDVDALPMVNGYVATTLKTRADAVLYAEEEAPLLAAWQYGIGRSAAFTSDISGKWTSGLLASDEGVRLLRNMVSWTMRQQMGSDIRAEGKITGDTSEITVTIPYAEGIEGVSGTVITPDMQELDISFSAYAPGVYQAEIGANLQGAYMANLQIHKSGGVEYSTTGVNIPYSSEYDITAMNAGYDFLVRLANLTGGRVLLDADNIFEPLGGRSYTEMGTAPLWLGLALVWLLADIAYHRFSLFRRILSKVKLPEYVKKMPDFDDLILSGKNNVNNHRNNTMKQHDNKKGEDGNRKEEADDKTPRPAAGTADMLLSSKKKRSGR